MHTSSLQTALQPSIGATPQGSVQARAASSSGSAAAPATPTSAAITSNDFLTLLVTELKHQDPTQQTDPNQYINQLVQINSLQQLIEINQNLKPAPSSGVNTHAASQAVASPAGIQARAQSRAQPGSQPRVVSGNLGTPHDGSPAAAVAHALARTQAHTTVPAPAAAEPQATADPIAAAIAQARTGNN